MAKWIGPTAMRQSARRHPVVTYVVLARTISWSCWHPFVLHGPIAH